jgi:hypothetical protein
MDDAVGHERRVISGRLQRSEETTLALSAEAQSIARRLSGLETEVESLKGLPGDLHAMAAMLGNVDGRTVLVNDKLAAANDRLTETNAMLSTLAGSVKELATRPPPACPACVCNQPARAGEAKPQASPTSGSASAPPIAGELARPDQP